MKRILVAIAEYFEARAELDREKAAIIGMCAGCCKDSPSCD